MEESRRPKSILSSFWLYFVAVMGLTILAAAVVYVLGVALPTLRKQKTELMKNIVTDKVPPAAL